jgi:uncharacterized protein YcbK (DUF882 family)
MIKIKTRQQKKKKKASQKSVKKLSTLSQAWKNGDSKTMNLNIFKWIVTLKGKIL